MNRDHDYGGVRDNQLRAWEHVGLFAAPLPKPPAGADATDRPLRRVRAARCPGAVVPARELFGLPRRQPAAATAKMVLEFTTAADEMNVLSARPQHDTFAIADAMLVAPGDPDRSILLHRVARRGRGQMPPLVSTRIDEQAVQLLRDWIAPMKPARPLVQAWQANDFAEVLDAGQDRPVAQRRARPPSATSAATSAIASRAKEAASGPDLTGIAPRQTAQELLKSILLPSDAIADEYATHQIETADGVIIAGRIEREDETAIVIRPMAQQADSSSGSAPRTVSQQSIGEATRILKSEITARNRLPQSNMPTGIVNVLKREEVLELLAYLMNEHSTAAAGK